MNRKIIISLLLIFTLALLLGLYSAHKQSTIKPVEKISTPTQDVPGKSFDNFNNLPELIESDKNTVSVSNISMDNFAKDAELIPGNKALIFEEHDDWHILFHSKNELFLISIIGSPFSEKKHHAEQTFLYELGITEEEACKLNVVITTPMFANPDESGKNYPLSFCE